jgi:transposase-like protein
MQAKRAGELRKAWGDKPCPHESLGKEYDLGERTGNYVCKSCGKLFTFREKAEMKGNRNVS